MRTKIASGQSWRFRGRFHRLKRISTLPYSGFRPCPTWAAGLLVAMLGTSAAAAEQARPNILFMIADDWSYPHVGAYGDKAARTPTFDRLAGEGMLFTHAFCATPSCTPSRGAILTGQMPHRLENGANLWSILPERFEVYPDILEKSGYVVGCSGKAWAPGSLDGSGRSRNPAGPSFKSFGEFLKRVPADRPFCFWFGSQNPHRPYERGLGRSLGMRAEDVTVPAFLPDLPVVRDDLLDYHGEVHAFDQQVAEHLKLLESSGRAGDTLVVVTSDNGLPFPRGKTNLYDSGTRMPLVIRWPGRVRGGAKTDAFVSLTDLAPTFVEAASLKPPEAMTGRSILGLLNGQTSEHRDKVFVERERHARARAGNVGYPARAIRTREFLYIVNLEPYRWPSGDPPTPEMDALPERERTAGGPYPFGDIDASPTKELIVSGRDGAELARIARLALEKRPPEELYDLGSDPQQVHNVAAEAKYADARARLENQLETWMRETQDPRATAGGDAFDRYPYVRARRN